jgi:hypothetical protein
MSDSPPLPDDPSFDDEAVEALLSGSGDADDALAAALAGLRASARSPEPSPALAQLFAAGMQRDEVAARRKRNRRTGIVVGIAVAGTTSLTLSGVAAAHDALPQPAQGFITGIINSLTPFRIEGPGQSPARPNPTDTVLHSGAPEQAVSGEDVGGTAGDRDGDRHTPPGDTGGAAGSGDSPDGSDAGRTGGGLHSGDGDRGSGSGSGNPGGGAPDGEPSTGDSSGSPDPSADSTPSPQPGSSSTDANDGSGSGDSGNDGSGGGPGAGATPSD